MAAFSPNMRFLQKGNVVIVTGTNAQKAEAVKRKLPRITIELADMRDRQALDELIYSYPDYLGSQLDLI